MSSSYGRPILIGTASDAQILEAVPLHRHADRDVVNLLTWPFSSFQVNKLRTSPCRKCLGSFEL